MISVKRCGGDCSGGPCGESLPCICFEEWLPAEAGTNAAWNVYPSKVIVTDNGVETTLTKGANYTYSGGVYQIDGTGSSWVMTKNGNYVGSSYHEDAFGVCNVLTSNYSSSISARADLKTQYHVTGKVKRDADEWDVDIVVTGGCGFWGYGSIYDDPPLAFSIDYNSTWPGLYLYFYNMNGDFGTEQDAIVGTYDEDGNFTGGGMDIVGSYDTGNFQVTITPVP